MVTAPAKHLLINTAELPEGRSELNLKCSPDSLELAGLPVRVKGDISCEFVLTKSGERVDVHCRVSYTYSLNCSRCLREFTITGSEDVVFHFSKVSSENDTREAELSDEDVVAYSYKDNSIDLAIPIRDAVLLSIPMKPLCADDCKGLCPVCGQDLNSGRCSCTVSIDDSRWDALKELKSKTGRD
jgi:uncharacterized protein